MTSWNDGYVVDITYTEGAFRELTPAWLSMVTVFNGHPPLDVSQPLVFVELGCGNGLSSLVVAATCPNAAVWACDFNPAHVERARDLARRSGLTNCTFEEASFEELVVQPELGPERADVIVLHGVYSWITPENRRNVAEYIRQRLAPGGLVYVSYNVMTGWASMLPLREAMRLQVTTDPRRSDVAILSAVATIEQLAEDGARSFPLGPHEQRTFESLADSDPVYIAHEYLGGSFNLMMFADVAEELSAAKCTYIGSCVPTDIALDLRLPRDLIGLAESAPDVVLRETICDLATNAAFRRDVYRRGARLASPTELRRWTDDFTLIGLDRAFVTDATVLTPLGSVKLDEERYLPVIERLAEGPLTLREMRDLPYFRERDFSEAVMTAALLVAGEHAAPSVSGWAASGSVESTARMNRMLVESARDGRPLGFFAAPAITSITPVDALTTLAIGELWDGVATDEALLVNAVLERLRTVQLPVVRDGNVVTGEADVRQVVVEAAQRAMSLVEGPFRHLGIQ